MDCLSRAIPGNKLISVLSQFGDGFNLGLNASDIVVGPTPWDMVNCAIDVFKKDPDCPPCRGNNCGGGGTSVPQTPVDPNDIIGYIAESGSHYIGAEHIQMPYMIEFENDTAFATAHAHTVVVKDTLSGEAFELNSFSATAFAIGDNVTTINGGQSFTRTVDMRPAIDVLAQVQLDYQIDSTFAVATWTFSSLDPITLQPTTDPTLGFLPANFNGDGTGEVSFTINRKAYLPDSTIIANRAYIKFDNEEEIATSMWVNIIDNTSPESVIDSIAYNNDTVIIAMAATDNLSGVWRYNVYGETGIVWLPLAMNVPADTIAVFSADTSRYTAFRTVAIDSAGNIEPMLVTVYDTLTVTTCDAFLWCDSTYTNSGKYVVRSISPQYSYCDTVKTLFLTLNHGNTGDTVAAACDGFTWWNTNYTNSTDTATHVLTNTAGCDSVITLHLTINYSNTGDTTATACDSYTWHGNTYTASTTAGEAPAYQTTNAAGCDSVVTLHLTVNYSNTGDTSVVACDSFTWWNTNYTNSTDTTDTPVHIYTNTQGCDSVVTLHLTVNYSNTGDTSVVACDSYTWHGNTYTASTTAGEAPAYQTTNTQGCDSVVTLHLTINYSNTGTDVQTACDSYTWIDGNTYTSSTTAGEAPAYQTTNVTGCDSVVTLNLTVNYSVTVYDSLTLTAGEVPYEYHGNNVDHAGDYTFEGTTVEGCDSTTLLHVEILEGIDVTDPLFGLKVYPNPTRGTLTIDGTSSSGARRGELSDAITVLKVEVMDINGRLVASFDNTNTFDISSLQTGSYTLRIKTVRGDTVIRIVKK